MIELFPTCWSDLSPYALSMLLAGFYLCLAPLLPRRKTWARVLVVVICLAVAVRYLAWRLMQTILPAELNSGEGIWYLYIYVVELFAFINYSIFYLMLSRWVDRSGEADRHEAEMRQRPLEQLPSVDVFIPTYNEGPDVLNRTILAALGIDYPKFQVWVLDDGARDWVAEFCAENGRELCATPRPSARQGREHQPRALRDQRRAVRDLRRRLCRVSELPLPHGRILRRRPDRHRPDPPAFLQPGPDSAEPGPFARTAGRPAAVLRGHGPKP